MLLLIVTISISLCDLEINQIGRWSSLSILYLINGLKYINGHIVELMEGSSTWVQTD